MSNNPNDILTQVRSAAHLLELAQIQLAACDTISDEMKDDLSYHMHRNRIHVDLTAVRLLTTLANGGVLE